MEARGGPPRASARQLVPVMLRRRRISTRATPASTIIPPASAMPTAGGPVTGRPGPPPLPPPPPPPGPVGGVPGGVLGPPPAEHGWTQNTLCLPAPGALIRSTVNLT